WQVKACANAPPDSSGKATSPLRNVEPRTRVLDPIRARTDMRSTPQWTGTLAKTLALSLSSGKRPPDEQRASYGICPECGAETTPLYRSAAVFLSEILSGMAPIL